MDQATIKAYDRYYKEYDDEVIEFWDNFPLATIDKFCNLLNGKKVLDLGSGSGRDALILQKRGLEVVCIDASKEMVKITKRLGFESIESDFQDYDFPELEYDGVWAYTSLLHIKKEKVVTVLQDIYKTLRPGGVFLVGMIEGTYEGGVEQEGMPGEKRYFRFYEEKELKEMIEKVGFKFEFQERYKPHSKIFLAQIYIKI
ncbi:MAG: class I SAM-dependent methyltransferase [Candidatus Shapirobacteria bacterium]|jgi:SAM-dependent methyltransferase